MKTINTTRDVSKIILPMKPIILKEFDRLHHGESMVITNEYNPFILYYQLLQDRGNVFHWEYLEKGPTKWKVKITKQSMAITAPTIGELAVRDYRIAEIFWKFGIDYCCSGRKTLKQACEDARISEEVLDEFYVASTKYKDKEIHAFEKWEVDFLADYIVSTHHLYTKRNIEIIHTLALQAARKHAAEYPELKELAERLPYFLGGLHDHMQKEEQTLFPVVKKLADAKRKNKRSVSEAFPGIQDRVLALESEHEATGDDIKFFRKLTRNYRLPADASHPHTHLFTKLLELENDLVQHIHLENNILFPKAVALEKALNLRQA